MSTRDPHRFVNELEDGAVQRLIARLESRGGDAVFSRLFDQYVERLRFSRSAKVLEVGCGTGTFARRLARRETFFGPIVGVDQSPTFIMTATELALKERVDRRAEFHVGDAHELDFPNASFDVVIAHTLISHVSDPQRALQEMARVLRPGGTLVVFDGDYNSLTYACVDRDLGRKMDMALTHATFNNPWVMRELPSLIAQLGLTLKDAWADVVAEIGHGSYFLTFAETYAPVVTQAGLLSDQEVVAWLDAQHQSAAAGTLFAACNYYTYFVGHA